MNKTLWWILGIGVVIRLFLAATTFHSDILAFDFTGRTLLNGHPFSFYDYLFSLPPSDPILKVFPLNLFNYPPIIYFFFSFSSLLAGFFADQSFYNLYLFNIKELFGSFQLNLHLLLFKLPYLIFDLGIAFILMALFNTPKEKIRAFALWIFNPITLYATFMVGQFDIIPTFFVVASLYLLVKKQISEKQLLLASLLLGIGATFKIYPLFLLAPLVSLTTNWKTRILAIIIGVLPYILLILPFLPSAGFRSTALVANQTLKSLYPQIPISGGESILLFLALLIFLYLFFLSQVGHAVNVWQRFFLSLLPFFIFTHYHPQWFLWLTPFLVLDLVKSNFRNLLPAILALLSFKGLLFFFDPGLTIGLFSPIIPALATPPTIWSLIGLNPDYNFSRSFLQTIFVGAAIYYFYYYLVKKREE